MLRCRLCQPEKNRVTHRRTRSYKTHAEASFSLNPDGPDFRTRCANGIVPVDCLHTSIPRADFNFSVKTVTDLENPFSHYMRFVEVKVLQFRRFVPSVIAEAAERYSVLHNRPPGSWTPPCPREFPRIYKYQSCIDQRADLTLAIDALGGCGYLHAVQLGRVEKLANPLIKKARTTH